MFDPEHYEASVRDVLAAFGMGVPKSVKRLGGTATPKFAAEFPEGRFVVRVRPEDMEELKEEVRITLIRKLMELEQRTEDLDEDDIREMEVLLGVTPA